MISYKNFKKQCPKIYEELKKNFIIAGNEYELENALRSFYDNIVSFIETSNDEDDLK